MLSVLIIVSLCHLVKEKGISRKRNINLQANLSHTDNNMEFAVRENTVFPIKTNERLVCRMAAVCLPFIEDI